MADPIEITTRYATSVDTLTEAWEFVMDHLDALGEHPTIEVKPFHTISVLDLDREDPPWEWRFGVVVSGTVEAS